jgi:cytochrome c556
MTDPLVGSPGDRLLSWTRRATSFSACLATALLLSSSCVTGQETDLVLPSTRLMKEQGLALYRDLNSIAKGETPYDREKVVHSLSILTSTSSKIVDVFPESSRDKISSGSRYKASPKIWETRSDFDGRAIELSRLLAALAGKVGSLEETKATAASINAACNNCHEVYRLRQ